MASRLELHSKLVELFGSKNVYYQPPESIKMEYPAIKYSKIIIRNLYANNIPYKQSTGYQIIVIDNKPDNPVIKKLLALPMCNYDRNYISDNLNHDVLTLYY